MINFVMEPTQEGQLRRRVLFWLPVPLPVLGLVALLVDGALSAAGWTILLAASVGVGTLLLAVIAQPSPLPEGLTPQVSARRSLHRFRQVTALRVALGLVPVAIGAAASIIGGGMYPLFASLALAWPQILLALPTFFTITRARRAMESRGSRAYLWHALSRPAKVTWPVVTPAARLWREWRQDRAKANAAARREDELRRSEHDERRSARDPHVQMPDPDTVSTARIPSLARRTEDHRRDTAAAGGPEKDGARQGEDSGAQAEGDEPGSDDEGPAAAGGDEIEPTAVMPALGEDTPVAGTPVPGTTGTERTLGTLLERGGALSQRPRRARRGAQSTRRPHSHKP